MAGPEGDPRVLFVMNLVLSALFSAFVFWLFGLVGITEFTWAKVGVATAGLMVLTYLVTRE